MDLRTTEVIYPSENAAVEQVLMRLTVLYCLLNPRIVLVLSRQALVAAPPPALNH